MEQLLELAERCEAATGADRDIDCWIENRLGLAKFVPDRPAPRGGGWLDKRVEPKPFTASLDAAMTLVDSHALWAHGRMEEGPFARLCWPMPNGGYVGGYFEAKAKTVPLAICAAALRAKAALSGKADDGGKG